MTLTDGFDLVMLLIVVFFAIKGLFHEFSGEVFSFAGILLGLYFGFAYKEPVDELLRANFPALDARFSWIIAIALIFLGICVLCALLGKLLSALLSFVSLSALDRLGGLIVGFIKGAAVVVLIVVVLNRVQSFLPAFNLAESRTVILVNAYLPDIEAYLDRFFPK